MEDNIPYHNKLEDNILIGNFMAELKPSTIPNDIENALILKMPCGTFRDIGRVPINEKDKFHYHRSWKWLMTVINKIESIKILDKHFCIEIVQNQCRIYHKDKLYDSTIVRNNKFQAVYDTVINFITWANLCNDLITKKS